MQKYYDLYEVSEQIKELSKKKTQLLNEIIKEHNGETKAFQRDGKWIRIKIKDNFETIKEKGVVWKSTSVGRYTAKIDKLKNKPKIV